MKLNEKAGKFLLVLMFAIFATFQCSTGFGPQGYIFTSTKIGIHGTSTSGTKTGSACVMSILGLIAFGDGSVNTSAANGGITKVTSIDLDGFSILGLFSKQCTIVKGE